MKSTVLQFGPVTKNKSEGILTSFSEGIDVCKEIINLISNGNQIHFSSHKYNNEFQVINKLLCSGVLKTDSPLLLAPIAKLNSNAIYIPHYKKTFHGQDIVKNIEELHINNLSNRNNKEIEVLENVRPYLNIPIDLQKHERLIQYKPTGVTILLTSKCNLNCTYCYSNSGENGETVTFEQAKGAIDLLVKDAAHKSQKPISISFLGGGEPTVEWDLLTRIVKYCQNIENEKGTKFIFGITTNGTLDEDKSKWISNHFTSIKISFDGIETIHNKQRPSKMFNSYQKTYNFMRFLSDENKKFTISMTLSENHINEVEKSLSLIKKDLKPETLILTPIFNLGRAIGCHSNFSDQSMQQLMDIRSKNGETNFKIIIPQDQMSNQNIPKESFCGFQRGKIYVTPSGHITMCPKVDNPKHPHFSIFNVASWNNENLSFNFNYQQFEAVVKQSFVKNDIACTSCSISSFCAGICYLKDLENIQRMDCVKTKRAFKNNLEKQND